MKFEKTEIAAYCDLAVTQVGLDTLKLPLLPESTIPVEKDNVFWRKS